MKSAADKTGQRPTLGRPRHSPLWIWGAFLLAFLICAAIAWMHAQGRETMRAALGRFENIRQARIDLSKGFLHLSLGEEPGAPFGQAEGVALLRQALASFEDALQRQAGVEGQTAEEFRHKVDAFDASLERWKNAGQTKAGQAVALRVAFNDLERRADAIDLQAQRHVMELSRRLDLQFGLAVVAATLLLGLVGVAVYLADRRRIALESDLRHSETRFRLAMEATSDGLWDWNVASGEVYYSPGYWRMLGYDPDRSGRSVQDWADLLHPDDRALATRANQDCVENRAPGFEIEFRARAADGAWRWILGRGKAVERAADGRALRIIGTHVDITARKQAETTLRDSETRFRSLVDQAADAFFLTDEQGRIQDVNRAACAILAYERDELLAMAIADIDPAMAGGRYEELWRRLTPGHGQRFETRHRKKDGSLLPVELSVGLLEVGGQRLAQSLARDISERKLAEERIRESSRRITALFNATSDSVILLDPDCTILAINEHGARRRGLRPEDLVGQSLCERLPPETARIRSAKVEHILRTGQPTVFEEDRDGRQYMIRMFPVPGADGEVAQIASFSRDITEGKLAEAEKTRLEGQLMQARKMEAIGVMAGGVAHDFNNILGAILGYAEMVLQDAKTKRANPADLEQIVKAGERGKQLVRQILTFSRKVEVDLRPLDLNQAVSQAAQLLEKTIPRMIGLELELTRRLRPINADANQLEQILLNLGVNAADAMPDGGLLRIRTENVVVENRACLACGQTFSGQYVALSVSDTGHGMDRQTIERIFEPFFTTKPKGKGTGLGLATVYGIVLGHGGHIDCHSELGQGTTFTVFFPALQSQPPLAVAADAPALAVVGGRERILLVDDEAAIRDVTARMLESAGYQVRAVASGELAIEAYRQDEAGFELVLMDMSMPGMGGRKAMLAIMAGDPAARVLIASGYAADGQVQAALEGGAVGYVAKPFRRTELLAAVRAALEGGQTGVF